MQLMHIRTYVCMYDIYVCPSHKHPHNYDVQLLHVARLYSKKYLIITGVKF